MPFRANGKPELWLKLGDDVFFGERRVEAGDEVADPLPARDFQRRFPEGAERLAQPGRAEPVAVGDRPVERGMGRRL